ncbi:hypothetical protein ACQBAU_16235 [Propionibacteriaceae bacterium Y2011]
MTAQDSLIPATEPARKARFVGPDRRTLTHQLRAAGQLDTRDHRCHTCRTPILTGDDADICAWPATVDLLPLTPLGEALAQIDGRHTYTIDRPAGLIRLRIRRRRSWTIRARPAGQSKRWAPYDVVAAHNCTPTPDALVAPSTLIRARTANTAGPPPF